MDSTWDIAHIFVTSGGTKNYIVAIVEVIAFILTAVIKSNYLVPLWKSEKIREILTS